MKESEEKSRKKRRKKKKKTSKIILILLVLLISIPLITAYALLNKLNSTVVNETTYESKYEQVDGITNILLLGTDGRPGEKAFRTDSMIIATIDSNNKNIKLTSLARDTYVDIPGKGKGKLNAAFAYGREDLLFQTIEENFQISLDKYVRVNFDGLMNIIFLLGGVQVDVKQHELALTNQYARESYDQCTYPGKGSFKSITSTGVQTLNGYQALGYTRIRYSDSAIKRDERQREVILSMVDGLKSMSITKFPQLLNTLLPYVSTNLDVAEMIKLATTVFSDGSLNNMKQAEYPIIDNVHVKGGMYKNAGWVWLYDLNSRVVLQDFIYKDINMEDNEYLLDNSNIQLNY